MDKVNCKYLETSISSGSDLDLGGVKVSKSANIVVSSGSDADVKELIAPVDVRIEASAGSDIDAFVKACNLKAYASGASDIDLEGKGSTGEFSASGASNISAGGLVMDKLNNSAYGSSNINACAKTFKNDVDSQSDIYVKRRAN